MRIVLIDVVYKEGSTGQIVYNLKSFLNNQGECAAACYGRGAKTDEDEKEAFKFGYDFETYIHATLTRVSGYTGCFSYFSTRRLIRFLDEFKPDIVHIHELHAYFVNINTLLSYLKKKGIKTVLTLHCEFMYTGKCGHSVTCEKWKTTCGHCPRLHEYPTTLLFDHTKEMFNEKKKLLSDYDNLIVVCPSHWLAERAKLSFLKEKEIIVIPNGINTKVFHRRDAIKLRSELDINEKEKIILSVAPHIMTKEKGGEYVIQMAKRFLGLNARFVLVGTENHDPQYSENIIMAGTIKDPVMLSEYYSMADVLLVCSERENFPTTCLEAQCCGAPICGFDTGGTKETSIIVDKHLFVDYADIDALYNALIYIFNEPSFADHDSISQRAIGEYSIENMCRKYYDLYKQF